MTRREFPTKEGGIASPRSNRIGSSGNGKATLPGLRESFHSRLRDELLSASVLANIADARTQTEAFRIMYNTERPHQSLGGLTPDEYKTRWLREQSTNSGD